MTGFYLARIVYFGPGYHSTPGEHQTMIAVIFEVWVDPEHRQNYIGQAGKLRALLEGIDGFISVERFQSLTEPDKILSLSFFRDEDAVGGGANNQ
jgi:heme-degrading monooxygenase HmoA